MAGALRALTSAGLTGNSHCRQHEWQVATSPLRSGLCNTPGIRTATVRERPSPSLRRISSQFPSQEGKVDFSSLLVPRTGMNCTHENPLPGGEEGFSLQEWVLLVRTNPPRPSSEGESIFLALWRRPRPHEIPLRKGGGAKRRGLSRW